MARTVALRAAALAATLALLPGLAAANTVVENYVPASVALATLSGGTVCAIGSSKGDTSTTPPIPAYYLASDGKDQGVWKQITGSTKSITALEVGTDITAVQTTPASEMTLKSAAIRFFVIPAATNNFPCSSISYAVTDTDTGDLAVTPYPYPQALFEFTAWMRTSKQNGTTTDEYVLTIDTSNVDSFEMPIQMSVTKGNTTLALLGNPDTPNAARTTLITGPDGSGGAQSPFVTWLGAQPNEVANPGAFANLALSSAAGSTERYPYALLQSPKDYLFATCINTGGENIPAGCTTNNALLHWSDPLNSYFETALSTFFSDAYADSTNPLLVMGDASGSIPQGPWQVASNTANCPVYLKPDGHSLEFKLQDKQLDKSFVLCNPVGQLVTMNGQPGSFDASSGRLTLTQAEYKAYNGKYIGWILGQPETGFIGTVAGYGGANGAYYVSLKDVKSGALPNPSYPIWAFTNVKSGLGLNIFETASEMVFANDGAFAAWQPQYITNGDLKTVALSVARNMIAAFSRGVALCNNVTMAASTPPSVCKGMTKVSIKADVSSTEAQNASDAYWANEANWFPAGGPQDYYTQYIHTAQIDAQGRIATELPCSDCANIALVPNNSIDNGVADSLQGVPMGMGYAFGYDENPTYVSDPSQVPSKLDPIPPGWGAGLSISVTIGRSAAGN